MEIEKDGDGYVNIHSTFSKKVVIGAEMDIKTFNIGFQASVHQRSSWKYYVGVYFLFFGLFIGIDW